MLDALASLTPSDWLLVASAPSALWFVIVYGLATKWWKDPLGWVVLAYAIAVAGLLGLIVYAIFVGERVPEWIRLLFAVFLLIALVGKVVVLHKERARGRIERRLLHAQKETEVS